MAFPIDTRSGPTLPEVLRARARDRAAGPAYTFLADGESDPIRRTWGELDRRARALASTLQRLTRPGDRALLLLPPGLELIESFFGCLYSGVVAVPCPPPRPRRGVEALEAVVRESGAALALTVAGLRAKLAGPAAESPVLRPLTWLEVDGLPGELAADWRPWTPAPDDLAFLQFTSGSTSAPRGVMISHGNLVHNEALIQQAFGQDEETVVVGWLPLYHDMGLIGNVLQPLWSGGSCVLMPPAAFLQRPLRWLAAISRHRATTSGGPNFAYELCARKGAAGAEAEGLDLSCWRVAYSGAEPVRPDTLERFAAVFAPFGFRREAFYPCYGLAESTLFVTGAPRGRRPLVGTWSAAALGRGEGAAAAPDEGIRPLVSCGAPFGDQRIAIVDPASGAPCPPSRVGELWIAGPSVAQGYWGRPEDTERVFRARLDSGEGPFLRTGDLGFVADGELYVTGRLKDLIIARGRNHYPQDVELTAERSHPRLRPGCGAAFGVDEDGEERLVVVQEAERHATAAELEEALEAIRAAVAEEHELPPAAVVLIQAGTVPKTTSGKVRRHACRAGFLAGTLEVVAERRGTSPPAAAAAVSAPPERPEELDAWLAARVAAHLGVPLGEIDPERSLAHHGLDSLAAMELVHAVEIHLGVAVPVESLLGSPSLSELSSLVRGALARPAPAAAAAAAGGGGGEHPLSSGQKGLFFVQQLAPESPLHNIATAARVRGGLEAGRLRRAFQALAGRHPALRTTFAAPGGEPVQRVHARLEPDFETVDAAGWSAEELAGRLAGEAHRPFDLESGPLLRVALFRRAADDHAILLTVHHIVADFWSLAVIARDLGALYQEGEAAALPALPMQPADAVRWEAERLAGAEGERLWGHWRERLAGELPPLALPTDRPRPAAPGRRGATRAARIGSGPAGALHTLVRGRGATLYAGLLAAFQALLHRWSGQSDLLVGSPFAGRGRAGLAHLVGYFVNLLPLRADLRDDPSFAQVLDAAREESLAALAHQDYPFPLLVERLQPVREPGVPPLVQAVLVLQASLPSLPGALPLFALGEPGARLPLGGLALESLPLEKRSAEFDLVLTAAEAGGELVLTLQYAADLFDGATIDRLLGHFARLLAGAAARPGDPLSLLPLLGEAERAQLIAGWAGAAPAPPAEELLHRGFEAQAARRPAAPALTLDGVHVSYGDLDRRADRLAHRLRALGVGPEVLVGLCAERSVEMIVGILGILKAGGAYLPLDPELPAERLELMLADARAPVLLAQPAVMGVVEGLGSAARILSLEDVEDVEGAGGPAPGRVADPGVTGASPAYVIYTSGSTGRPKGVVIPHRRVARLFSATDAWFGFSPDDVWTLFHSFTFDFSVWEIWGALLYGGRLVLVPHGVSRSPEVFRRLLADEGVTVLNQTPSAFRQLAAADAALPEADAGRLRWIVFGGEALELRSLDPWLDRYGGLRPRLVNMYGITETTVHVTWRPIDPVDLERPGSPVGVPIPDLRVHLLDRRGEPAPIGVPGEIHVGGEGLARGYLRRPDLTAARFVPDPFGDPDTGGGARLYRSGDLARRLSDGSLQFLGRIDHQVKVRGFRIEPGEIEAALRRHPGVRDAVVLARRAAAPAASPVRFAGEGGPEGAVTDLRRFLKRQPSAGGAGAGGEARLVAWVVAASAEGPTVSELRRHLQETLPEYMVPAAFVRLDALPLTANGKLDTRALPAPAGGRPELDGAYEPPQGPVEEPLAEVWAEVLGLDRVGAHDNFFELGGDSIRSIQVRARAEARGLRFTLQDLFAHQSVRGLALSLEVGEAGGPAGGGEPPFSLVREADRRKLPPSVEDAYPLARIQAGVIFHSQDNPEDPMYHDIFLYQLRGRFDLGGWTEAVQRMLDRHAILRTSFDLTRFGEPLQLVHAKVPAEVWVVDLRTLPPEAREAAQEAWIAAEKRRPFAWGRAPLIRFFLHRMSDAETHLVLSFHDAILDGWSTALLLTELLRLYFTLLRGERPVPAPPPRVSFSDFVALERQALESAEHRAFWARNLSGCIVSPLPRWPRARRRGAAPVISVLEVPVTPELSDALKRLARRNAAPLKHVLLASHLKVMALLAGHPDVLTGVESNGRLEAEQGELTLGIHLNSIPFRLILPPGSWSDLVRATFEAERALLPYRRFPLAELQKGRSGEPLFEAVFNYTHFHVFRQLEGIEGLEVSGARGFGETHFVLRIEFNRDPFSDRVQLDLEGDVEEIPRAQLEIFGGLFARTLAAMVTDPDRPHGDTCLLAPAELQQVFAEWNPAPAAYPRDRTIHALIEDRVRQVPVAVAVAQGEAALTYRELDAAANRLARWLRAQGAGPGRLVGILTRRSPETIVAVLGVLKAGAAYVPLDPEYPREHLARVIADAGPLLVLSQERLPEDLRTLHPRMAFLDAAPAPWSAEPGGALDARGGATPDDAAYVIYTSGSTGTPKGVEVTHRNLVASTFSRFFAYKESVESYLLVPSFAFDSSVAGLFWTLCAGGKLVLLGEGGPRDLESLTTAMVSNRVTHVLCIPSLYALLLAQAPAEALDPLAAVIVAGEACPPDLPAAHRRRLPEAALYNEYGPTEGTVWATVARCDGLPAGGPVPIGRPIPNARIHLADHDLQPVPPGVPGEILLGGEGVARGYLGRPELTAERFVPDPWSAAPGGRLYRTGDLGRHLPAGEIEFLGRRDQQVKIRGFRVELGEIEQALARHPAVAEAAVVARDDGPGGRKQLAAYVVPRGERPAAAELKSFLAAGLPEHMVPRAFVVLDDLPRTPNGKVDRRRLPEPRAVRPPAGEIVTLLQQLESFSEEEIQALLAARRAPETTQGKTR